ncbi:MAG: YdcF family protein [Candidatus Pacebacteria bacterium]|nr:YdcF family protein [Candidatus Paceibacterota bacterium]
MFFDIIQKFILPSVFIFFIIFLGLILILSRKKSTIGRVFIVIGLVFYYLFSITPITDMILTPLERGYKQLDIEEHKSINNIVIFLGGRESDVLRASEVLRISHLMDHTPRVIISGVNLRNTKSEKAPAVKDFFSNRGIPAENIVIESSSQNTLENARNVARILEDEPFFLVTSAHHMKRSIKEFERIGLSPTPAPANFKIRGEYNIFSFFPSARNLRNSNLGFHEYFGILFINLYDN